MQSSTRPCSSCRLLRSNRCLLRRKAHLAVQRETSEPGASSQGRDGFARSIPGFPAAGLPFSGPEPQHTTAAYAYCRHRGRETAQPDQGAGEAPWALGPPLGLPPAAARRLERQPQAGAKDLAGGGAPAAPAAQAKALSSPRRLKGAAESRMPTSRLGD